jgi:DNA repair photolyase
MTLKVIYEPKGRAGEYAELALNHYIGCDHGCTYCYAPNSLHKTRDDFSTPVIRKDLNSKLLADAKELQAKGDKRSILLSFACDPYCKADVLTEATRFVLDVLLSYGLNITILTKGGARSTRDFDIMRKYRDQCTYGTTLTFVDEIDRKNYEPYAAPTSERKEALRQAHLLGIKTIVSLEPVIKPLQTLKLIEETREYVDQYKVGTWNYDANAKDIDYKDFGSQAIRLFEAYHKSYYIKNDLKEKLAST